MNETTTNTKKITKLGLLLKERGLTQLQFIDMVLQKTGDKIGADRMSRYCSGKTEMMVSTLKRLATTLGVPPGDLID